METGIVSIYSTTSGDPVVDLLHQPNLLYVTKPYTYFGQDQCCPMVAVLALLCTLIHGQCPVH